MTYEEFEKKCEEITERNAVYLNEFRQDLKKAGLKEKTIQTHCFNIDLYIDTYLLREEPLEMREGTSSEHINDFLGYYFIRKCMWSTPASIKSTAASIKKFYKSMLERGHIEKTEYDGLIFTMKNMLEEWMELCRDYNDPEVENPFAFF